MSHFRRTTFTGAAAGLFEGQPSVTLKVNQALFIPAGTVHAAKNVGTGNAAELATYVVEKGKPLVVLAESAETTDAVQLAVDRSQ